MIDEGLLIELGAQELKLEKGAFLFHENDRAKY